MQLCLKHRHEDLHECKPVKDSEMYEKIAKSNTFFNWGGSSGGNKKKDDGGEMGFCEKLFRCMLCCGGEDKSRGGKEEKKRNKQ